MVPTLETQQLAICIDLELTCWNRPNRFTPDIIQIGTSVVTADGNVLLPKEQIVKPNTPVSRFCTKLTGLSARRVHKDGISLKDACIELAGFSNLTVISWGDDWEELRWQCDRYGVEFPLGEENLDLSELFKQMYGLSGRASLKKAVTFFGKRFRGIPHSAGWDSYNLGHVLVGCSGSYMSEGGDVGITPILSRINPV